MHREKKIQSILVDGQCGLRGTLRVKPLTWGHGPNFGSPEIWVMTDGLGLVLGECTDRYVCKVWKV